ncbi:MAG: N-methyl-L-tryptophan oxidase [Firmicutes bacterium]|nr:N-methyl-L-tryptophan oxidase [Bacillota bacterium]
MSSTYDVIVIGLGAMGAAALYHLARRGQQVLGLEQFSPVHAMGSSAGESRIIRQAYFEHPDYVPLVRRAWDLWRDLAKWSGIDLLWETGGLIIGPEGSATIAGVEKSVTQWQIPHEWLSPSMLQARFPAFRPEKNAVALYEPQGGVLRPEIGIMAHVTAAVSCGAQARWNDAVQSLRPEGTMWQVETLHGTYRSAAVVIATGMWTQFLLPAIAQQLWVEREPVFWIQPPDIAPFLVGKMPWFVWETDQGPQLYGFPTLDQRRVKMGIHHTREMMDITMLKTDRTPSDKDYERVMALTQTRFPALGSHLAHQHLCFYTNAPDERFMVGPDPVRPQIVLAAGFSGHGYKFAPVIGEIVADYVLTGTTTLPAAFLRPNAVPVDPPQIVG